MKKKKKKDKLKETARPKTWIWEAYFHLFFLVIYSFMFALFFSLREMERDMPFLSACASLWCFSGLLFCMGPAPEPCTGPAEQPVGLPRLMSTLRQSHQPLPQTAAAKCSMNVTCFNKCSQTAMPRLNQQEQLLYRRHQREQYIQPCYHDTGQNVSLSADNQHAVRRLATQSISTSLRLNVRE